MDIQIKFYKAIKNNDINNVKLLLKDKRVNPSDYNNVSIIKASEKKYFNIINILWKDKRVKTSLKEDCFELYEILIKKDKIKEKVEVF